MQPLTTVMAPLPADAWDDILKFMPDSPNLGPFTPLATAVSALGALILGAITIIAIILIFVNAFKWITSGSNPQKAAHAKDGLKTAVVWLLVVAVFWSVIIAFIVRAGQSIT